MALRSREPELERVRTMFLQMCVRAESMVRLAVRSVMERDPAMGRSVVAADRELDRLELEIDRQCMRILAIQRPVGRELRLVTTCMKMVTDLERIGDLAVNIAERGLDLTQGAGVEPGLDIQRMGDVAADMIRMAADAFVAGDAELARRLIEQDAEVDALNRQAFNHWVDAIGAHPDQANRALALTSMSKYLERVADHACNLGEMVVFLVEGEDMRHGHVGQ